MTLRNVVFKIRYIRNGLYKIRDKSVIFIFVSEHWDTRSNTGRMGFLV
jgi:hypothetical protein